MNKWIKMIVVGLCCASVSSCCWMPIEVRWKGWGCQKQEGTEQAQTPTTEELKVAATAPDVTKQSEDPEVAKTNATPTEPKNSTTGSKSQPKAGGAGAQQSGSNSQPLTEKEKWRKATQGRTYSW